LNPYRNTYVQNAINVVLKGLDALWILSSDLQLMIWSKGLKSHLKKKIEEAKREEADEKKKRSSLLRTPRRLAR